MAQVKSGHKLTVITKYSEGCKTIDENVPFTVYRIKAERDLVFSFLAAIKFNEIKQRNFLFYYPLISIPLFYLAYRWAFH